MYQRPDSWVRGPQQILRWRTATSAPKRRTAGPDVGLCIPMYVLGIRQSNMSKSLGPKDFLRGNLHQDYPQCRLISKAQKIHFGATSKALFQLLQPSLFQIESARPSSSSCCAASLVWSKGLVHYCMIKLLGWTSASRGNSASLKLWQLLRRLASLKFDFLGGLCPYIAAPWELTRSDVPSKFGLMVKFLQSHRTLSKNQYQLFRSDIPQSPPHLVNLRLLPTIVLGR